MALSDNDQKLIERCLAGDAGSWEEFVHRFLPLITHVVNSCIAIRTSQPQQQLRDDIVAEVMLAIVDKDYRVLRRFRGQSTLTTYLVVVARRIAIRALAKQVISAQPVSTAAVDSVDAREDALQIENDEEVHAMLDKLPGQQATVIRMYHLEHRNYGEIGESLGIPENSVGPLLSKARARMKEMRP
ncbi:MAG: sigma-70 family RNA polymerase sigma factor [Aureliella sp.]